MHLWQTSGRSGMVFSLVLIGASVLAVTLPGIRSTGPLYPDGMRYTFNGIMIHDMFAQGAFFHPYAYAVKFYSYYPATNLPYGPPFHALVFAAAFGLFGISFVTARFVTVFYTLIAIMSFWYLVYRNDKSTLGAFVAAEVLLLNPLVARFARDIATELPVVFYSILTVYFFIEYVERDRRYHCLLAAVALILGYFTKPHIFPLAMSLPVYVLVRRKFDVIRKKETIVSVILVLALVVPYTLLSLKFFTHDLGNVHVGEVDLHLLIKYPKMLMTYFPLVSLMAPAGLVLGIWRRNHLAWLSLIWVVCWYLFFTFYLGHYSESRYLISILPALVYLFSLFFQVVVEKLAGYRLHSIFAAMVLIYCVVRVVGQPVLFVRGYEQAGQYVAEHPHGETVLYYGNYDGAFMLGVRRNATPFQTYILRGDRVLADRLWWGELKNVNSVKDPDEIRELFQKARVGYVVIEEDMPSARSYREYVNLKKTLATEQGPRVVHTVAVESNYGKVGPRLDIYRIELSPAQEAGEREFTLEIPSSALKQDIEIKIGKHRIAE